MPSQNDITGDRLVTKVPSEAYKENYDKIFGRKEKKSIDDATPEEWDKAYREWKADKQRELNDNLKQSSS